MARGLKAPDGIKQEVACLFSGALIGLCTMPSICLTHGQFIHAIFFDK